MDQNCHLIATELRTLIDPYVTLLSSQKFPRVEDVRLSLSAPQLALFSAVYGHNRPSAILLTDGSIQTAQSLTSNVQSLASFLDVNSHWHLLEGSLSLQEIAGDVVSDLSQTLHLFLRPSAGHHFVLPTSLLAAPVPDAGAYRERVLSLHRYERTPLSSVVRALVDRGYVRRAIAVEPGCFCVRGEHLDVRLPNSHKHYQIMWHRESIEQIVQFEDEDGQRAVRRRAVASFTLPPAAFPVQARPLKDALAEFTVIKPLSAINTASAGIIHDALLSPFPFPLSDNPAKKPVATLYVLYENYDRVTNYLREHNQSPALLGQTASAAIPLSLHCQKFSLVSESALFQSGSPGRSVSATHGRLLAGYLKINQPAVHSDHGIGIFAGLQTRTINAAAREYLILQYAAGDTLSVPVEYAHKVTPYLGEKTPPISRLGGTLWQKTRRHAEHDAQAFARDLIASAGQRAGRAGERYKIASNLEEELSRSFPHALTPDQATTLQAIYSDLSKDRPLDRLIVGDVGFGKTELALQAARHVIANGRQVALLAPTTLLVQQHFDTARQRFPDLRDRIGLLSRFVYDSEQQRTRQAIANGTAALVIGTHALFNSETIWHNLGLVIVDEEQRFGVKHKEHFKKIRATVDFLSLSATPIPRTLSMALSGLKELSVIGTPPVGRKEVVTQVTRLNAALFKQAIEHELARDGQVYIVAPKVRLLGTIAHQVKAAIPRASLAVAHGQLPPQQLAGIMHLFDTAKISVLVSSSIIANGLDLPNANTIIVMNAPHFGLSDLYQLRGRVGRRSRQGFAYFFYNKTDLTPIQRQRLTVLTEASRLGAGWSLARRDLEIRGAGNLLGAEQSGTVNQVGVQFYLDLVHDAAAELTNQTVRRQDVDIQLPLAALIPAHYIAHDDIRSAYYQQLGRAATPAALAAIYKRITDDFGNPPEELKNLVLLLNLQHKLSHAGISHLVSQQISPADEDSYWRLTLTSRDVKAILQKLQLLGAWTVRNNTLTLYLNDITSDFLLKLCATLA